MAYDELKPSGITASTPQNILLGAGTIHKGFTLNAQTKKWNFAESIIGATTGGSKLSIVPETKDIEVDGATVLVKGLRVKIGEKATLETNFAEMTPENIKMVTVGDINETSAFAGYSEITSKARIEEGDYIDNFAFVGKKTDGTPIIIIFDSCICTSGFETEPKNKENATFKGVFECAAEIDDDTTKLPWHILYPSAEG